MGPLLYFDNGNEAVAAFPLNTLSAITTGDQIITLYFGQGSVLHNVVLSCADDASDAVGKALIEALAPMTAFHQKMITVADEQASSYLVSGIAGVTSITADAAAA
jgi:hypothetical protein